MRTAMTITIGTLLLIAQLVAAPGTALAEGQQRPRTTARATLHVEGMIGESCPALITSALKRVDGVGHVEASYATRSATVEYDAARVSLDEIRDTIRSKAGFATELAH